MEPFQFPGITKETQNTDDPIISYHTYKQLAENVYVFDNVLLEKTSIEQLYEKACAFRRNKQLQESINAFLKCEEDISSLPNNIAYEVYVNLALLYSQSGNVELIKNYYEKAKLKCPERAEPDYYFALYCLNAGKIDNNALYDEAIFALEQALTKNYDLAKASYPTTQRDAYDIYLYPLLINTCFYANKVKEAKTYVRKVLTETSSEFMSKEREGWTKLLELDD
jgi:tetratricopeptide (TPR) repeat protein